MFLAQLTHKGAEASAAPRKKEKKGSIILFVGGENLYDFENY